MNDLIEKLSSLRSQFNCFDENERDVYHTLSEAIKVLSERSEPCEDAVSRADVVDMLEMYPFTEYSEYEAAREVVKRLPSVTLKPDHIGDATEMVEYDDCVSRQAVADVAYEVGNLFDGEDDTRTPYGVAFDIQMAVDKLPSVTPKSEPCEDAVSRKSVEDVLHGYFDGMLETDTCSPKDIYGLIELLPSVTPKQESCEDAVSRKDVIDLYKRGAEIIAKSKGISVEDMPHNGLDALMNLPPVTPKWKKGKGKGKWIDQKGGGCCCSECGRYALDEVDGNFIHVAVKSNYCPNCGAKMNEME